MSIEFHKTTWEKVFKNILRTQKNELYRKCKPENFMNPYDHDKIMVANEILFKLNTVKSLDDIKEPRYLALKIGVKISSEQIFNYLSVICNPINYVGKEVEFENANNLYSQILECKDDIEKLEYLLLKAQKTIVLHPKKSNWYGLVILILWESLQVFLWAYKGVLYNATDYFYPINTFNLMKYDYTEFLIYGIVLPITIFCSYKLIKIIKKIKIEVI